MRNLKIMMFVLAGLLSASAMAEKVAVVDVGRAIFAADFAKARLKQLQAKSEYASMQAKYDSTGADIKALQKEVESKRMTASKEQMVEYQKKMEYLNADIELVARKLEGEIKNLQGSIMKEAQPKALESIQELVKEEGVTLLLQREAVIFAPPEADLTAKLTDRLNKKMK